MSDDQEPGLRYPLDEHPEPGDALELAPGLLWLRLSLPFQLAHINVWLLKDGDGWALRGVDGDARRLDLGHDTIDTGDANVCGLLLKRPAAEQGLDAVATSVCEGIAELVEKVVHQTMLGFHL